jgi:hypothetical protein
MRKLQNHDGTDAKINTYHRRCRSRYCSVLHAALVRMSLLRVPLAAIGAGCATLTGAINLLCAPDRLQFPQRRLGERERRS